VHEHRHGHGSENAAALCAALTLIVAFMGVEVAVGILGHSLALLSDAVHMLTDAAALGVAIVALRLARRPARGAMTYGLRRAEILSAQFNGATLLVLGGMIVFEGIARLIHPPRVQGLPILAVAIAGIAVNIAASAILARADRSSMNVEGAFQHVLTDIFAFVATAVAGGVIIATGFARADAIASLVIATAMLAAAYRLLRDSGRVFLEAAPKGLDPEAIGRAMIAVPAVHEVHDLHVWEVTTGFVSLSAHVLVDADADCHEARRELEEMLGERYALRHTTLQVDHEGPELITIEPRPERSPAGRTS
jgi:cobalt-zinc-cadmium efflux system protein